MKRLQTFPDDYKIEGGHTEIVRQLGNAVPSLITEVLGREIRVQLLDESYNDEPLRLMPPLRTPVPPPECIEAVPEKYHEYIGDHAAHPGTGKGHLVREDR
jgi:DNA (cytosine-5)-methyltransferase 1